MNQLPVVDISAEIGESERSAIADHITRFGAVLLQAADTSKESLTRAGALIGDVQSHVRSDPATGVTEAAAKVDPSNPQEWHKYKSEYQAIGTYETPAHSDGTFVDGAIVVDGGIRYVGPPRMIMLQVAQNAKSGGESFVVDGHQVLCDMLATEPDLLTSLMTPGCMAFCRDDQMSLHQPVFTWRGGDRFALRFRSDARTYAAPWAQEAVRRLRDHYAVDPQYRRIVPMEEGQILVLDNSRMMHGRQAFVDPEIGAGRRLRRLWIWDPEVSGNVVNMSGETPKSRALSVHSSYRRFTPRSRPFEPIEYRTGICLEGFEAEQARKLAADAAALAGTRW
jgi:alpha-ketoglutarate-dependent taurine dioxygenase